ncbi:MAG: UvrD-helicase domain-containing protein [Betaproteobacteria bacterium]|nr:UvrD-helicase domain-containing protein [Betaproteobacteria bacterium]
MTAAKRAVLDQEQRALALDSARSFIVQAPAGSGKTSLLVDRFLALLGTVREPEEVVAITFTRKAAAEMRARVIERISPELAPRLRIQTIDALCAALTAQMPVLARFGAQPAIAEDASELYREAAARTLADITPPVARLLAHLDNNVADAAGLLAEMLARRDQWLRQAGGPPVRAELEAALAGERERLVAHARALHAAATPELAKAVLTKEGEWRKRPAAPPELQAIAGLREALAALLAAPPAAYTEAQWEALEAILALLRPALAQLRLLFAERGEVDFTEIAHGALGALGTPEEPTDLLLALDVRVKHLLVDEFQDTSNSQWELLERLTAGWEEGDGRTVFVVGDPMQSIYRFRDAQVGLFLHARRRGLPGVKLQPLTLSTNFRSQGAIVDWVNRVFPRVLPADEDESSGAVPYSPSVPFEPGDPTGAPALELFADGEAEARRVVELVRAARGKTAILVRNRSHLDATVPALKAAGIAFRAVEIEQLGEKQVVQDLYALTRALTHLGDRVAWLALLRAPWCGLTLEELAALFEPHPERTIWESMQGVLRLARIVAVLAPALENRLRGTLRDRVEGVWLALGGPACLTDPTDLEDAEIFFDELERLEEAGELEDFAALAESLAQLFAEPDVEAGPEAIEIMTIHKAKGLEFHTVIVPGLDRGPRSGRRPLFAWRALAGGKLLLAPIDETGGEREPLYRYVRALEREAEDIEAGRLLYVAATRAASRLHLLGCVKVDEDGVVKMPPRRSLLGLAWEALQDQVKLPAAAPAAPEAKALPPAQELRRLPADFRLPEAPEAVKWKAQEEGRDEEAPPFDWAKEAVRHAGIVVHAWLQRIAEDELRGWYARRIDALRARIVRDLERRGVAPVDVGRATGLVVTALKNTLADERGRWLLGPHPVARSEYRLRSRLRSLRIDRYIEDARGVKWIVDYKLSEHEGGGIEAFLDAQRERYSAQLDRYSEAVGGARRGLYFPLHRGWREW